MLNTVLIRLSGGWETDKDKSIFPSSLNDNDVVSRKKKQTLTRLRLFKLHSRLATKANVFSTFSWEHFKAFGRCVTVFLSSCNPCFNWHSLKYDFFFYVLKLLKFNGIINRTGHDLQRVQICTFGNMSQVVARFGAITHIQQRCSITTDLIKDYCGCN